MSYERLMAAKNLIAKIKIGSHLYGTNTPLSDTDYLGIFIPDMEYVMGLKQCNIVDLGTKSKLENGKNDLNAIDFSVYSLPMFMKLIADNSINVIEPLFCDDNSVIQSSNTWDTLVAAKEKFLSRKLINRIIGYAKSQEHKMIIRSENFTALLKMKEFLDELISEFPHYKFLFELEKNGKFPYSIVNKDKNNQTWLEIGDLKFLLNTSIKTVLKSINHRLGDASNRSDLILNHGYDTKFASHYLRLLLEGVEILHTETLSFPLKSREFLIDVKNGMYSLQNIQYFGNELKIKITELEQVSTLPAVPDIDFISNMLVKLLNNWWNGMLNI